MRALVTGSAGFLGRRFAAELRERGWSVSGVDVATGIDAHDVFDRDTRGYAGTRFDLVVHCAAVAPHRAAIDGQAAHLVSNLALDAAMFDWAVRTRQHRVLYMSSSAAYPVGYQRGYTPYRLAEQDADPDVEISVELLDVLGNWTALRPDASYGWAKVTGEAMAADARNAGVNVHVVRPFSGYGEEQGNDWPFGAFTERARRRVDPFTIWGDGTQVRDWVHASDVVNGALVVVDADYTEPVNLCTGVGTSMLDLVERMCRAAGYSPRIELRPDKPAGVAYRVGSPFRMETLYTPKVTLDEGIARALR